MQFKQVVGQQTVKQRLINAVKENRVSHAQLFLGPEGGGNLPMAIAFAQYLVCETPGTDDSCGQCSACKKMEKMVHPDVSFSYPVAPKDKISKPRSVDFAPQWRNEVKGNPYLNYNEWMDLSNVNFVMLFQIGVENARQLDHDYGRKRIKCLCQSRTASSLLLPKNACWRRVIISSLKLVNIAIRYDL